MHAAVITFPGSNCDRDLAVAFERAGFAISRVWHKETGLPDGVDVVGLPGGFSFGDYLRCGAIAAQSPICGAVRAHAKRGGFVIGICNGFQVLCETGLLPGALMRNAGLRFVCRSQPLSVTTTESAFLGGYQEGQALDLPIAHHDGNYQADADTLRLLDSEGRIAFRYRTSNPNGSAADIAGVVSENGRILGMMPHPERAVDPATGGSDGAALFRGLIGTGAPV
ncbi:MAG: phosphoribosylformylglycinamidine synthase subunit PurQ [Pseudomonadota bacterium]